MPIDLFGSTRMGVAKQTRTVDAAESDRIAVALIAVIAEARLLATAQLTIDPDVRQTIRRVHSVSRRSIPERLSVHLNAERHHFCFLGTSAARSAMQPTRRPYVWRLSASYV